MRFHYTITLYDFTMIDEDHCVYIKQNKDKCVIIFIMDDILIIGNDLKFVQTIKKWLLSTLRWKIWEKHLIFLD